MTLSVDTDLIAKTILQSDRLVGDLARERDTVDRTSIEIVQTSRFRIVQEITEDHPDGKAPNCKEQLEPPSLRATDSIFHYAGLFHI